MSGPQHIAWFETAMQEIGQHKLFDLSVVTAPWGEAGHLERVQDALLSMARGKQS